MAALTALEFKGVPRQEPGDVAPLDEASRAVLNQLRLVALDCRAAARTDLFEACALLSMNNNVARTAHADALMKCLPQATGKTPKILRPGVSEVSFDEAWIMRLVACIWRGDTDSFEFLLRSRVQPWARRNIGFLIKSLSEQFSQT